jgi:hypothetical protein
VQQVLPGILSGLFAGPLGNALTTRDWGCLVSRLDWKAFHGLDSVNRIFKKTIRLDSVADPG